MLFAGIDGGQSSTVALVGDESGILGRGTGPPADLVGEPRGSTRQADALDAALAEALAAARLDSAARFDSIVAGISGFEAGEPLPQLAHSAARLHVVHDTEIAHAGALGGAAGIVVIAGTGSVALGNDDLAPGRFVRAGGWGYFFDDEGSALWLARSALRRAMARFDRAEASALGERALEFFGAPSLRAIQQAVARGDLERPRIAAFAREVVACAASGDDDADEICTAAAQALAELATVVDARLAPVSLRLVSSSGGLFDDAAFYRRFGEALQGALPHADLIPRAHEPAAGALALARRPA